MTKVTALFFTLLLCSMLVHAMSIRLEPAFHQESLAKPHQQVNNNQYPKQQLCVFRILVNKTLLYVLKIMAKYMSVEAVDESCEGVGEDECLMRRTLAAHVDYIYTQKHNNP
ncbi:Phytosulfokine protein [Glycine max]|nr:Phytosulfokine protein [Glycine max]